MGNTIKGFSLLLVAILAVSSLIMVESASAQSIPKPSVPQFTVNLTDSSYDTPTTTTTDPYTGKTVTHPGQHIEARTIEIRIKYVPFTPFEIQNGSFTYTVYLQYDIRWKGHFEVAWRELYSPMNGYAVGEKVGDNYVVSYQGNYSSLDGLNLDSQSFRAASPLFPLGAQVDFQVEALVGSVQHVFGEYGSGEGFEGQKSGWSSTQTLTIPETSASTSPNPTPTPTVPELSLIVILPLLLSAFFIAIKLRHQRKIDNNLS